MRKPNPLQDANFCSRLFFWWLNPLFKIGHKRRLEEDDMYSVLLEDRSQHLGEELQGYWDQEVLRAEKGVREPSLTKAIINCHWKSCLVLGIFILLEEGTRVVQPIFLGKMINYVENSNRTDSAALHEAYGYAAGLSTSVLVWAVLHHLYFYHIQRVGMRLRVAVCHMIYRKVLRLNSLAMGKTTTGQIVNLLSNDVSRFDQVTMFLHYLWVGPLQAIAVTALLWMETGISCLAGMAVLIFLLLFQSCFGMWFSSLRSKTAALTDDRIRTMSEFISGIKTVKMYAWEKSLIDLITRFRRKEISKILKSFSLKGMNLASFFAVTKIMIFITFITNVALEKVITASQVFVVVTLYEALLFTSTLYFPMAIDKVSQAIVSIQRIKNFLLLDERSQLNTQLPSDDKTIVHMKDFTGFWDKESETPTLQGLSFTVRPGELLAVVGPVGAGKSSLLHALLGELPPSQGQVIVHGRIMYVSQQPWVFSGTVRSNILFGKKYEEERYEKVIQACALEEDLQLLKENDLTEIGEWGTLLSEGQKARVSLARAVYQDADIYLLDDPLSTVDAGVSRHLFKQCVRQALKEKITILVTHQLQYLKDACQILILKDGKIMQKRTFAEVPKSWIDFEDILLKENEEAEPSSGPGTPTLISEYSVQSQLSSRPFLKDAAPEDQDTENIQVTLPLEGRSFGRVGFKTYANYFTAGAHWFIIIFLILVNIAAQVSYVLQDWWLPYWANGQSTLYAMAYGKGRVIEIPDSDWYLTVHSVLTAGTILSGITRSLLIFYVLVNSSQTLHKKMLESIFRAPMLFFDRNPIGRILNHFSKDIGHMDDLLPLTFLDFIQTFLLVIGVVGVMVAAIPWIAIPVIPLGILFFVLQQYFLQTSRDVKCLECTTRSLVFSHLASSLRGLWTIWAYKAEQKFQELFDAHQDLHSALDLGQVGLVLSLTLTLSRMFQWCVRQSAEVENMMISVERVIEYTDLEKEAPWELEYRPPPFWPNNGEIYFNNVNFRYKSDSPLVLRNLETSIYSREKSLCLSSSAMGKTTTGQIVNLLSNDVSRFDQVMMFLHYLWVGPLQCIAVTALLWMVIGISCLAGMAVLIILLLLQSCFRKLFSSLRKEISKIMRSSYLRGMNLASFFTVSKIMIFVTFITNDLLDNLITASQVFVVLTLFEALRFSSTLYFPMAIEKVSEAIVSIQRVKNFLLLDEITQCYPLLPSDGKTIVDVQAFTASWEKASETPALQELSFTVRPGELLAVVGHVGAGKSSLLSAVLGELPPSQGKVRVHGRIAYVSQQPWVFPGTVRSNILFGKKYEKERYEEVIKACALEEDLQFLEEGDLTEIGERGTLLSEGQKSQVSLARAVYQDADIYLLDDPLSAVDALVIRHLFEKCIHQALKEKITILVTHQLQYLKDASQILILKHGIVVKRGTYSELLKSGIDIFSLFENGNEQSELSPLPGTPTVISESLVQSLQSPRCSLKDAAPEDQEAENIQVVLPLEDHLEGKVGFKTYKNYFTAGADWSVIIFLILVNIAAQVAYALQDWWLADWANVQSNLYFGGYLKEDEEVVFVLNWFLGVYSGLTVSTILFGITRSLLISYILVNSSRTLHNKMLETILRSRVLFFHRNPIGRILNRFSKDIGHMDDLLPLTFLDFIQTFLLVIGVVGVMVAAVPWTAIPVIPLGIVFFFLWRYFLETSRDVKRLECTKIVDNFHLMRCQKNLEGARSPVFSHLASSLQGLWTIRAYKAEQKFQELFDAHQVLHSEAWFLLLTTSRWLAVYLNVICAIFVTVVAFGALILVESLDAGHVGLVLSLTIILTRMFQWCVRQSVEVENMMISVERGIEYTDLGKEAPWELEYRPPPSWPHEGEIYFRNVNFRHKSDGPLVLRNVYAAFYPGRKYGIVGRTGAGKSSLIAALFRLSEPEGDICIDDTLTTRIGLHDLRKKISVALQEPVLFTGTMRKNLDPCNEHTEEELWNALEEVQLKDTIEHLPGKMNTELAESRLNLSVGQKQLVCLARAILKKNQILIIDKATSNVDPRTDELIQKKIREKFAQCTVLTIAHRLSNVIDCQKIMVLDSGRQRESGWPYHLLQNKNSLFYKMLQPLGEAEAAALTERAKQVYFKRK